MKLLGFKIWYADGVVWWQGPRRQNGPFSVAPNDGVLEMCVYREKDGQLYREMFGGHDWYFSDDGELFGSNSDTLEENKKRYPTCTFKRGKWVSKGEMQRCQDRTRNDRLI